MAENARPPVAVRIVRPYDTEESFLESELETVGKTSVILIGAHSRPTGVILRFEVTLASGATVLRGEGRVLAHKENAFRGQSGLALRFTRLDPKSKALVDRAAAIREARLSGDATRIASAEPPPPAPPSAPSPPPPPASVPAPVSIRTPAAVAPRASRASTRSSVPPSHMSMPPDPVLAQILTSPTPPPPPLDGAQDDQRRSVPPDRRSERPTGAPPETRPARTPPPLEEAPPVSTLVGGDAPSPHALPTVEPGMTASAAPATSLAVTSLPAAFDVPARSLPPPPDRDALLSRLRQRAASLTDEQKAAIFRSS